MRKAAVAKNPSARRLARAAATRRAQARLGVSRLSVHLTGRHAYAQILSPAPAAKVLASASTAEKALRQQFSNGGNAAAAAAVGSRLAEKAKQAGLERLAFDRGGRKYAGRVRALAEAARAGGLKF